MIGAWPTQPLTVEPMRLLLREVGIFDEHAVESISQTTGWLAWVTMIGVLSYPTSKVFGNIYDAVKENVSQPCKEFSLKAWVLNSLYGIISGVGVASRAELAIRYTTGSIARGIVTSSAVVGRFALNYFTIDKFFNCSPPPTKKQRVLEFIDKIHSSISQLNEKAVEDFYQLFEECKDHTDRIIEEIS